MSETQFYVLSRSGLPVAAQFLMYNGQYVSDPNKLVAQATPIYDSYGN
jgi:hypothetical protein